MKNGSGFIIILTLLSILWCCPSKYGVKLEQKSMMAGTLILHDLGRRGNVVMTL